MSRRKNQVKVLIELIKVHRQHESLIKQVAQLHDKEKSFIDWLAILERSAFRVGDHVMIQNNVHHTASGNGCSPLATVRFTKKDKARQIWVYITTAKRVKILLIFTSEVQHTAIDTL